MEIWYNRTQRLIGEENYKKIQNSCVAVVGLGGVGGSIAEALCRSGVGKLIIMDFDDIDITNINRQIIATTDTVSQKKVDAFKKRLKSINPDCEVIALDLFYNENTKQQLFQYNIDYIADAIDTVSAKIDLAVSCKEKGIKLIQSMGTGNRLNPSAFKIGDISDTAGCGCGLARVMRRELKKRGITAQPVLYSTEMPVNVVTSSENGRHSPASIAFCPPVAGYLIAGYIINDIIK